jgi:hypothetical protein
VAATWCWDYSQPANLTSVSFDKTQASEWDGFGAAGITVDTRSGGVGEHTASQTFTSRWIAALTADEEDISYWVHVVGGSTTMDFVETSVSG